VLTTGTGSGKSPAPTTNGAVQEPSAAAFAPARIIELRDAAAIEERLPHLTEDAETSTSQLLDAIVDEAQDLSPWRWRLLRAVVPSGPDDLLLVGDTHQRIYDHRVSLKQIGIDIAGQSERGVHCGTVRWRPRPCTG
jgi:hypothetical protein